MKTTTSPPFAWLKKIPTSLMELDEIPLFGHPPTFSWGNFSEQLAKNLDLSNLTIEPSELQWRTEKELLSGLGDALFPLKISLTPFEGDAYWVMPEKDVQKLMALMLIKGNGSGEILEKEYTEGFYRFLALEVIHAVEQIEYDPSLAPKLNTSAELPDSSMLCMDIAFIIDKKQLFGRLFISPELRKAIREHYAQRATNAPFNSPLGGKLEVTVHLEGGSTALTLEEWSQVKEGDFLLLDQCSLKSQGEQGRILLTIGGHPLFRGEIQDGSIKILESFITR